MNNLHRELAPISDAAWAQIEEEITPPDVRQFMANSGSKVILRQIGCEETLRQDKHRAPEAYGYRTSDIGAVKHGNALKRKSPHGPFCKFSSASGPMTEKAS